MRKQIPQKVGSVVRMALVSALLPISVAYADGFVILKSSNIDNYNDAVMAFKTSCGSPKKEFDLADSVEAGLEIADEVSRLQPDAVFAVGVKAALAARKYLPESTPVVYAIVLNPDKHGLDKGNTTGVLMDVALDTELKTIKGLVPNIRKLGALYNPKRSGDAIDNARRIAQQVGFELVTARVESSSDTVYALKSFAAGVDAMWLIPDPTVVNRESIQSILEYSFENRIPVFAFHKKFVQAGVLLSLSPSYEKMGAQACEIAQRVQKGTAASSIAPESPKHLEIAVNVNTARNLNLQEISMNAFSYAAQLGYKIEALQ